MQRALKLSSLTCRKGLSLPGSHCSLLKLRGKNNKKELHCPPPQPLTSPQKDLVAARSAPLRRAQLRPLPLPPVAAQPASAPCTVVLAERPQERGESANEGLREREGETPNAAARSRCRFKRLPQTTPSHAETLTQRTTPPPPAAGGWAGGETSPCSPGFEGVCR